MFRHEDNNTYLYVERLHHKKEKNVHSTDTQKSQANMDTKLFSTIDLQVRYLPIGID